MNSFSHAWNQNEHTRYTYTSANAHPATKRETERLDKDNGTRMRPHKEDWRRRRRGGRDGGGGMEEISKKRGGEEVGEWKRR